MLVESGLKEKVELKIKKGEIRIVAAPIKAKIETTLLSEKALSDWNRPEEDKAWESLQMEL